MIKKNKKNITNIVVIFCILSGVMLFLYPFYVNSLNYFIDQKRIEWAQNTNINLSNHNKNNEKIQKNGLMINSIDFSNSQSSQLSKEVLKKHVIGSISIPKINQKIALFDYTSNQFLEEGATVVQGTSFPTGNLGEHTLIAAHTGLPERKLFTDLDRIKSGDNFYLDISNKKMAYKVIKLQVVLPEEVDKIKLEKNKNLVTLITCTPYMINTHRLLVTGEKIPYTKGDEDSIDKINKNNFFKSISIIIFTIFLILFSIYSIYKIIVQHILQKKKVDLFISVDENSIDNMKKTCLYLYKNHSRKPLKRAGKTLELVIDNQGKILLNQLPKQVYFIKSKDKKYKIKFGYSNLKQKNPKIFNRKPSTVNFEIQKQQF